MSLGREFAVEHQVHGRQLVEDEESSLEEVGGNDAE